MDKIYNMYDIDTIGELAKIVKDNELSEITLVDGGKTITIKGKKALVPPPAPQIWGNPSMSMPPPFAPHSPITYENPSADVNGAVSTANAKVGGNIIKSPIVGTFYSSSAPDKPPFVTVGQSVKKGDVVMIIESMKLMNEIKSDFDGVVQEILVSNGEAVEFDQPIMIIK